MQCVSAVLYCHPCVIWLYRICAHYLTYGTVFEGKISWIIKYVFCFFFFLQILSEMFFIPRKTERDLVTNVHISSCKFPAFLTRFYKSLIFSTDFRKILKCKISWKSVQWELSCCMQTDRQTDGQTDMTSLIATFNNFSNGWLVLVSWCAEF